MKPLQSKDGKLLKRLGHFMRPYTLILLISFLFAGLTTGFDLAKPYIIKLAIDDHLSGDQIRMQVSENPLSKESIAFGGKYYTRDKKALTLPGAFLYETQNQIYLVEGDLLERGQIQYEEKSGTPFFSAEGKPLLHQKLSAQEYKLFRQSDLVMVKRYALYFLILILAGFFFTYGQAYLLNLAGQNIILDLRVSLFSHLQRFRLKFFDTMPIGKLVTRLTNDMQNINEFFTQVLISFIKDILLIGGTIVLMMRINFKVSIICLLTVPLLVVISIIFRKQSRVAHRAVKSKIGKINASLSENISAMKIIQLFGREKALYQEFDGLNRDHYESNMKELLIFSIFRPSMDLIFSLGISLLLWFGGKSVIQGQLEFGVLFAFTIYLEQLFRPIFDLGEKFNIFQSAITSTERVFELLDTEEALPGPALPGPAQPQKNHTFSGDISFRQVCFSYNENEPILKNVSFDVKKGETLAIVGATGSGKTTIISLLKRLYDIQKGEILLDDMPIQSFDLGLLRQKIAAVLQDVFIFSGTVRENISLKDPTISDEKIKEVCRYVNADSFIEKLPAGYDEPLLERGANLSTGQRQLLSFARALAFSPDILIMDEATSNIDTETEHLIQEAVLKIIQDRTTIIIAHRLSTIQHADKIIVLHKGEIREVGNHQSLLEKGGLYYDLYRLQYKEDFSA